MPSRFPLGVKSGGFLVAINGHYIEKVGDMNLSKSIATNRAKKILNGVTYSEGSCGICGTVTIVNSWDDIKLCAKCRVISLQEDEKYSRITCETVFANFGERFREQNSKAYRQIMPLFFEQLLKNLTVAVVCQECGSSDTYKSGHSPMCVELQYRCRECGQDTWQ